MKTTAIIIPDSEIIRVHGYANFGDTSPRDVVDEGVLKYAFGYGGGHTQLQILQEHRLVGKSRGYHATLTKKGQEYARCMFGGGIIEDIMGLRK